MIVRILKSLLPEMYTPLIETKLPNTFLNQIDVLTCLIIYAALSCIQVTLLVLYL